MSEKRKDNKGRNLFTGESQRKDGSYMYRFSVAGKRKTIYAPTLNELRQKEKAIRQDIDDGISISNSEITVAELLQIHLDTHLQWKRSTRERQESQYNVIKKYNFSKMKIKDVKMSDVRDFCLKLHYDGKRKGSIKAYKSMLVSAFKLAYQDDWIRKNPAEIDLDFLPSDSKTKKILSESQEKLFLDFVRNHDRLSYYCDIFILFLDTGIRAAELVGLTLNDIDLKNKTICINHQLKVGNSKQYGKRFYIETTKSENGSRTIPLTARSCMAINNLLRRREWISNVEPVIDGYSKFLLLTNKYNGLITHSTISYNLTNLVNEYNNKHEEKIPALTPHSFRHTFCTRMVENGVNAHALQYIMGHGDIRMTYSIYTHYDKQKAIEEMRKTIGV